MIKMSKEKELAKNTVILSFGKICTQFVSFLLLPFYTSLLTPQDYGILDLLGTYVLLLVPLFNLQLENGLFRFLLDYRNIFYKQSELFTAVFLLNCAQSVFIVIVFVIVNSFFLIDYQDYLVADIILTIFLNTLLQFSRGLGDNISYAIGSFISVTTLVIFNILLLIVFKMGLWGMLYSLLMSKVISILYLILSQRTWRYVNVAFFKINVLHEVLNYSIPLVPNQLSWWVLGVSDRTIITIFLGVTANGIYSLANKFSSVISSFYNVFNLSWTESVSLHINDVDRDSYLSNIINLMFKLFSSTCIFFITFIPLVFFDFIDDNYKDAYFQIPILILAVFFQIIVGLYSVVYIALKKTSEIAKTSLFAAAINFVINLLFVKEIGIYAASLSTLISFCIMSLYRYFHVKKFVNVRIYISNLIKMSTMFVFAISSYYYNNVIINVITFIISVFVLIIINKDFISSLVIFGRDYIDKLFSASKELN